MLNLEVVGQGATTKIYRDGNTAIKLYENAPPSEVENEAMRQRFAFDAGLPVPAVFGVRRLGENVTALDMEYINGHPLMRPGMDKDERKSAIHSLIKLQCMVHKVHADGLPKQADCLAWKIENSKYIGKPLIDRLLDLLNRLNDDSDNLCHGDFHPLNVLYNGTKHWIIDWVDATAGSPLADACRTYLIFLEHMKRSAGIYLRVFCKETSVKSEDVLAWLPVIAAARLSENMDDKSRTWLLSLIKE
ncbi:MAG: aminoglycoside phosphotransferase family protein [Oscillospiraceae bacterium]|nr:aminoglycoside phosphotransferase family protein [Oscillospiraceae bacterium]